MKIIVLAAGEGKRTSSYNVPKPLIKIKDRTIMEWTTRSFPYFHHRNRPSEHILENDIYFAIRQDHEEFGMSKYLIDTYGENINIINFQQTTRGNLETAYIVSELIDERDEPLIILDCDNKYDADNLWQAIQTLSCRRNECMLITCFDSKDNDNKWAYANVEDGIAYKITEKDNSNGGYPMVGIFYFSSTILFRAHANNVINNNIKTNNEFYMSQVPQQYCKKGTVYVEFVQNVVPLGTTEDIEQSINKL